MFPLSETKLTGRWEVMFGEMVGRVSGVGGRWAREYGQSIEKSKDELHASWNEINECVRRFGWNERLINPSLQINYVKYFSIINIMNSVLYY